MPLFRAGRGEVVVVKWTGFDPGLEFRCCHFLEEPLSRRRHDATSVRSDCCSTLCRERSVSLRTTISKELPHFSNFRDHVEIKVRDNYFILIAACLRDNLTPRIAEITLTVKFADAPWFFRPHPVDRTHEISIGDSVGRLFQFPQVFR